MSARVEMAGQRFGRWLVLSYAGGQRWNARCDCGREGARDGRSLRSGRSSGCTTCHASSGLRTTHGGKRTRLYNIWCGMKARCLNPNEAAYPRYGGRGIKIALEWLGDFAAFRAWAEATGYADHLTIDRVNNDGHYEPANCRWSTYAEQARNYRRNRPILWRGEYRLIGDIAEEHGLPPDVVKNRVRRYGWPIDKALSTPVSPRRTFTVERRNIDEGLGQRAGATQNPLSEGRERS